jgi:hypothetical protein
VVGKKLIDMWLCVFVLDSNEPRISAFDGGPKPFSFSLLWKVYKKFHNLRHNLGLGFFLEEKEQNPILKPPNTSHLNTMDEGC